MRALLDDAPPRPLRELIALSLPTWDCQDTGELHARVHPPGSVPEPGAVPEPPPAVSAAIVDPARLPPGVVWDESTQTFSVAGMIGRQDRPPTKFAETGSPLA